MIHQKRQLRANKIARLCDHDPLIVCVEEDPAKKGTIAHSLRCSRHRRINEVIISTPVAIHQRVASYTVLPKLQFILIIILGGLFTYM